MLRGPSQGKVGWAAESDLERFVCFVQRVFHHRNGDGLGGFPGAEGECPGSQGVVGPGTGSGTPADGVVHGGAPAGNRRECNGQGGRSG